jgi:excisionase family DNA binding protein
MQPLLTVRDLCLYLKVHPSTIYRLVKTQQLPAFNAGRDWRFNLEDINRWLARKEVSTKKCLEE